MALQVVPEDDLPSEPAANEPASTAVPEDDLPEVPDHDLPDNTSPKEETSLVGAGLEGVAKGVAGPLTTGAELGLSKLGVPGLSAEDQAAREEQHPVAEGVGQGAGFVGSFFTGVGEAALIGRAAEAASGAAQFGKIGSVALKGAIEAGLFQGGDEVSKYMLGQSDPEAPVSSALAHIGAASLLGGTGGVILGKAGSKLQELAEGKTASRAAQLLSDLGNRFDFLSKTKDIAGAATEEVNNLWGTVRHAYDEVWGSSALKSQAIEKLVPEMSDSIRGQTQGIANKLQNAYSEIVKDPDTYPPRFRKIMEKEVNQWMEVATSPEASSHDIFNANQELKQRLQQYAKFDKSISAIAPERGFVDLVKGVGHDLRTSLEDKNVWGGAGELQSGINKAFSELRPYEKDFLKSFSVGKLGEKEIDPDRVASLMNQVGKGKGSLRASKLADYIEPAQKFLQKVDDLHTSLGVESATPKISTNVLDEMLSGKTSNGSKLADALFHLGPKVVGAGAGATAGYAIGEREGGTGGGIAGAALGAFGAYRASDLVGKYIEEGIGRKITKAAVPAVLKLLSTGEVKGIPQIVNYAESMSNGAKNINNAVDNAFTIGGPKYLNHDFSEASREALKKYVAEGKFNQQLDNQKNEDKSQASVPPTEGFAHGGEVMAPKLVEPSKKPAGKLVPKNEHISTVFPEQGMLLGAAKGRINNYLNQIRPQEVHAKRPFDDHMPDKVKEKSYHRALDIANKPLSVMDHIKNGTLEPEHVQHMNALYPELTNHLKKKISEKIVKAQMENEKPPYKVRQSLSLFMGSALDSNLTPQNIMAAQATFMKAAPPPMPGKGKDTSTKGLGDVSNQFRTKDQAVQERQLRSK